MTNNLRFMSLVFKEFNKKLGRNVLTMVSRKLRIYLVVVFVGN